MDAGNAEIRHRTVRTQSTDVDYSLCKEQVTCQASPRLSSRPGDGRDPTGADPWGSQKYLPVQTCPRQGTLGAQSLVGGDGNQIGHLL